MGGMTVFKRPSEVKMAPEGAQPNFSIFFEEE
jgi:hypothetical protein